MSRSVRWSDRALVDLERIFEHIAKDNSIAAERWVDALQDATARLARFPGSGRVVPETNRPDVREVIKGNYRVVYQVISTSVVIATVFESHHQFPEDLGAGE